MAEPLAEPGSRMRRGAVIASMTLPSIAAASAGILAGNVPAFDGVRPGLALYGLVPDELPADSPGALAGAGLRPVMSLHARPVRVADLPAGWRDDVLQFLPSQAGSAFSSVTPAPELLSSGAGALVFAAWVVVPLVVAAVVLKRRSV